jgi:hypothetical protein
MSNSSKNTRRSTKVMHERASAPATMKTESVGQTFSVGIEAQAMPAGAPVREHDGDVKRLAAITTENLETVSNGLGEKRTKGTREYDQGLLADCKRYVNQIECAHDHAQFRMETVDASTFLCVYADRALQLAPGWMEHPGDLLGHVNALVAPQAALGACLRIASERMDADIDAFPPGLLTDALKGLEFLGTVITGLQKAAAGLTALGVDE